MACAGRDAIAVAKTGSGKTLAFLLPVFHRMALRGPPPATPVPSPTALVLAPTRELALQIHAECERFGRPAGVHAVAVYGGAPMGDQKDALRAAAREVSVSGFVVVATPGRLCDLMTQRSLALDRCHHLVLDEADRMLDMGFEPQLREVFAAAPPPADVADASLADGAGRPTHLFNATWPKSVRKMAAKFLAPVPTGVPRRGCRDGVPDGVPTRPPPTTTRPPAP